MVISGLVGKMLLQRSREHVQSQRDSSNCAVYLDLKSSKQFFGIQ